MLRKSEVESLCDRDSKTEGVVGMGVAESTRSRSSKRAEGNMGNAVS